MNVTTQKRAQQSTAAELGFKPISGYLGNVLFVLDDGTDHNHRRTMNLLRKVDLRLTVYQEILPLLISDINLKKELEGKRFRLAVREGTEKKIMPSDLYTVEGGGELVKVRRSDENPENVVAVFNGSPRRLIVLYPAKRSSLNGGLF